MNKYKNLVPFSVTYNNLPSESRPAIACAGSLCLPVCTLELFLHSSHSAVSNWTLLASASISGHTYNTLSCVHLPPEIDSYLVSFLAEPPGPTPLLPPTNKYTFFSLSLFSPWKNKLWLNLNPDLTKMTNVCLSSKIRQVFCHLNMMPIVCMWEGFKRTLKFFIWCSTTKRYSILTPACCMFW